MASEIKEKGISYYHGRHVLLDFEDNGLTRRVEGEIVFAVKDSKGNLIQVSSGDYLTVPVNQGEEHRKYVVKYYPTPKVPTSQ